MKVLLCRADSSGCAYYRVQEPALAVTEQGLADVEVVTGLDVDGELVNGETRVWSVDARGADVVVLQRPTVRGLQPAIERLQRQDVAVVVEVDDLLSAVDPHNAAYAQLDPRQSPGANHRWVLEAARRADWVTVSTPALLSEYARHGRGSVVRNAVPRRVAELTPSYETAHDEHAVIGWTGSVATHPNDLQEVGFGLKAALEKLNGFASFTVIGQAFGAQARLGLTDEVHERAWLTSVDDYLFALGTTFDIGLAPLANTRFNQAKSFLKPLEYAARGVASVQSVTPEYRELGLGWFAKRPLDWQQALKRLAQDLELRVWAAQKAHERVLQQHLTEHTASEWVQAWKNALEVRHAAR